MAFTPVIRVLAFYGSLALFGAAALAFSVVSLAFAWLPASTRTEKVFQRAIQLQLIFFLRWLRWVRVVEVNYRGWEEAQIERAVIVANHPGLVDAFYLLARVPRGFCIFKRAIRRNPFLSAPAWRAGYLANDTGIGLIRGATQRIVKGASLVVFPEGTRTPRGAKLGTLRPGFAAIARRGGVPVQLVRITVNGSFLAKDHSWLRPGPLPARVVVEAGPRLQPRDFSSTAALVAAAESWWRTPRPANAAPCAELTPAMSSPLTAP